MGYFIWWERASVFFFDKVICQVLGENQILGQNFIINICKCLIRSIPRVPFILKYQVINWELSWQSRSNDEWWYIGFFFYTELSPLMICLFPQYKPLTIWITTKLWKIPKQMWIPDHLTCLLRNLYAGQKAVFLTLHGTTDWFKTWNRICEGCILSSCLFNLYAEYIMWNARLDDSQAGINIAGRNNNLRYADDSHSNIRKQRGTKQPFDEDERGEWKSWPKIQHSKN